MSDEKTMKPITFRATDEEQRLIKEAAAAAGCRGVSEYIRRRVLEDSDDGVRDAILTILEYVRSISAHINLMMDMAGTTADERQEIIQKYKYELVVAENDIMGKK